MVEMDADAGADAIVWLVVLHHITAQIQFKVVTVHFADIDTDRYLSGGNSTMP